MMQFAVSSRFGATCGCLRFSGILRQWGEGMFSSYKFQCPAPVVIKFIFCGVQLCASFGRSTSKFTAVHDHTSNLSALRLRDTCQQHWKQMFMFFVVRGLGLGRNDRKTFWTTLVISDDMSTKQAGIITLQQASWVCTTTLKGRDFHCNQ